MKTKRVRLIALLLGLALLAAAAGCMERTEGPTAPAGEARTGTPTPQTAQTPSPQPIEDVVSIQEPTPEPTPEPTAPQITPAPDDSDLDDGVYDAYFDGAVFVGDSVTQGLEEYINSHKNDNPSFMGDVRFLATQSYMLRDGYKKELDGEIRSMSYQGEEVTIHEGLRRMGATRVFILLGLNDWVGSEIETGIKQYGQIIDNIREFNPGIDIVVESVTPVCAAASTSELNSQNMDEFNVELVKLCAQKGVGYVDVNTPLKDDAGNLNDEYSSDHDVHLNNTGLRIWIRTLREYAREQYQNGAFDLPE